MSWSRKQARSFAAQGAALRQATDAEPAIYEGHEDKPLDVCHTAVRSTRDIVDVGFEQLPSAVCRVNKAAFPWFAPVKGKRLTIEGTAYRITEVACIDRGGEWWFALGKA